MSKRKLSDFEIEAMKARIEEQLDDVEAAHFAYESWMINWRLRQAEQRAKQAAE